MEGTAGPGSLARDHAAAPRTPETLLTSELDTVDRIVGSLARRHRLNPDEHDEFGGWVRMKLVENDYAILRKYEGRSSIATYLSVVLANLLRDWRVRMWGRWRPSAAARRAGPDGVELERLTNRDGHSVDSAIRVLRSRGYTERSDREWMRIAASFPERGRPRTESDPEAVARAASPIRADEEVLEEERAELASAILASLEACLSDLPDEDRVILKLRYWHDLGVADIARALHLEQRPLYRRVERLLGILRKKLSAHGVSDDDIGTILPDGAS